MEINVEKNKYTFLISLLVLQALVIFGLGYMVYRHEFKTINIDAAKKKLPPVTVETQFVSKGLFEKYILSVGTLKANETVKVASQEGGVIEKVLFESGQKVSKGDPLIQFESEQLRAQLNQSLSKFKLAKSAYDRSKVLLEKKIETQSKFEEIENAYHVSAAMVEVERIRVEKTVLKAPFDGYLGLREVSPGAYIKPGQEIVTLDNISPIFIDFMVNEKYLDTLSVGQDVQVEIEGYLQNDYRAVIESIEPSADAAGHTIRVRAKLDNVTGELRPGFFAKVKIVQNRDDSSVIVPESALENSGNVEFVYTVIDGVAKATPVLVSGRNGKIARISRGLRPGQVIITTGQQRVRDGADVFVRPTVTTKKYQ